jgi:hypothetical protein
MVPLMMSLLVGGLPEAPLVSATELAARRPIHVVIDSDAPGVRLWRRTMAPRAITGLDPQAPLCTAPCDVDIYDVERSTFFVDGPLTPESSSFGMQSSPATVRLKVASGDLGLDRLAWVVGLCGGATLVVGVGGALLSSSLTLSFAVSAVAGLFLEIFSAWLGHLSRTIVHVEEGETGLSGSQGFEL